MQSMRRILLVIVIVGSANRGLGAQVSPADSAAVLLAAAQELLALGEERSFEAVLQLIISRFPDTPAGREAAGVLDEFRGTLQVQSGRTALTVWSTIYGTWLGVAIPAALGADDPSPYGAGLLIGAPLGFFASRAYATGTSMSSGQAGIIIFGSWWGTYQGLGWYQVANSDGLGSDCTSTSPRFSYRLSHVAAALNSGSVLRRGWEIRDCRFADGRVQDNHRGRRSLRCSQRHCSRRGGFGGAVRG